MNDRELYRRARNLVADELLLFAEGSATGNVWRAPEMLASIVPATPDRSLFNGMQYASIAVLRDHYDAIASAYDASGIRAWTVWTDPGDTRAADLSTEGDCAITGLAALPETRGQRIGTRLLACALRDAQLKGAYTASLQATSKGVPVYATMGFRDLGRMGMWEKRKPAAGATPKVNT